MPPILFKNLSGGIIENIARNNVISSNIARNNVISNNNTENINNSKKLHRRQDDTKPTPVDSIPTVTISPGSITFTFTIPVPTDIIPTSTNPTATDTPDTSDTPNTPDTPDTDTNPTDINSTSATAAATVTPTVISTPTNTNVFTTSAISSSEIIPTKISTPISSGIPKEPTITTQTSPSSPSISLLSPPPVSVPSNNASNNASNNFHAWLFPILAILLLIIILAFLGFIYKKRKRNTSTDNLLRDVDDEDIMDKDKEHDSKTNSLTSSINSVSSFKIKRGKVAPEVVYTGSPPALIAPIVSNDNDEEELKRPVIKRTPTTVSVFTEMVNLTEEENNSLRLSIASRQSSTPSYVQYVNYHNVGESSPSIAAIPLHQERIDAVIPFSIANEGGGGSASASGSGIRTSFATSPFDSINDDNDDND